MEKCPICNSSLGSPVMDLSDGRHTVTMEGKEGFKDVLFPCIAKYHCRNCGWSGKMRVLPTF